MRWFRRINRKLLLRYRLEYLVALTLVYGVRAFSPAFAWDSARALARLAWRLGLRRKPILRNLEVAFPELTPRAREEMGERCMEHFFSVFVDILFQRRMINARNLFRHVEMRGWTREYLDEHGVAGLQRRARGLLFLTGHLGNWELSSGVFGLLGVPIVPIYRAIRNPFMDRLIKRIRLVELKRMIERRGAVRPMLDTLAEGENVGMLFDQEAIHGVFVPFFGTPARTHKTPAILACDHGVRIFFGWMRRKGDFLRYEAQGSLLDLTAAGGDRLDAIHDASARLMAHLEEQIRVQPEQYFWMHRRWKRTGVHGERYLPENRK